MRKFYINSLSVDVTIKGWTTNFTLGEKDLNKNRIISHHGAPGRHKVKFDVVFHGLTYPIDLHIDTSVNPDNDRLRLEIVNLLEVKGSNTFQNETTEIGLNNLAINVSEMTECAPEVTIRNLGQRGPLPHFSNAIQTI